MAFDEKSASAEELWEHYMEKYKNPHPIARKLTDGFFNSLDSIINSLPPECSLLEIGCGPGESTRRISNMLNGRSLEASEYEQRLVEMNLRHEFPVKLSHESVYELQREDNSYDTLLLLEVLEHLDDFELALQEIFRVARHSVIVSTPNEPIWRILNFMRGKYWSDWGNTPGHINHWSSSGLAGLVSRHGEIISISKPLPWTIIHARKKAATD